MIEIIKRNIEGRRVLVLFILTNIIYLFMLTVTIPRVVFFSGGMKLLDMMPTGYDHEYVNKLMYALGEQGRAAYLFNQIPVDMIYPFLFGVSNCLLMAYILNKLNRLEGYAFYCCLLPLCSGIFDYAENTGIITMLNIYPDNGSGLTQVTNVFSILKSSCTTVYFVALIVWLVLLAVNKLRGLKRST